MACIYCITNTIDGKRYIGQTIRSFNQRKSQHILALNAGTHHNEHLQNAWNKQGEACFKFETLEVCSAENVDDREKYWIEHYQTLNSDKGYNLESGGNANRVVSEETKKKHRRAKLGERNPQAILTDNKAQQIKIDLAQDGDMQRVAKKYGVSYGIVKSIRNLKSWVHIAPETNEILKSYIGEPNREITSEIRHLIIELKKAGYKHEEIVAKVGVCQEVVTKTLKANNINLRCKKGSVKIKEEMQKEIMNLVEKGFTHRQIGPLLGIHPATVSKVLKKKKIKTDYGSIIKQADKIFKLKSEGFSNREIARRLNTSHATIGRILKVKSETCCH